MLSIVWCGLTFFKPRFICGFLSLDNSTDLTCNVISLFYKSYTDPFLVRQRLEFFTHYWNSNSSFNCVLINQIKPHLCLLNILTSLNFNGTRFTLEFFSPFPVSVFTISIWYFGTVPSCDLFQSFAGFNGIFYKMSHFARWVCTDQCESSPFTLIFSAIWHLLYSQNVNWGTHQWA